MPGPLEGLRVLDLSRVLTGPFCSMTLGDMGAEVIKIEIPKKGDDTRSWGPPFIAGESAYFLSVNRNKKSVTLDLKTSDGREILYELATKCDILLENFRPGITRKLQIDFATLAKKNPRLIYCSITSFGQSGEYRDRLAYDIVLQGMGGLMGVTGELDSPPVRVGVAISDIGAGMYAAIAILAALNARQSTGKGQWIDISLLDGTVSWMTYMAANYFANGKNPEKMGSAHPNIVPYQCFKTLDERFITVAIGNDKLFQRFCKSIGLDRLADDPRFATNPNRVAHRSELIPVLERTFHGKTRDEWLQMLQGARLPVGPVYPVDEIFSDPQVLQREMLVHVRHRTSGDVKQIGIPMKFSETKPEIRIPPPLLGEHVDEVLRSLLGYDSARIAELKSKGIV